MFEPLSSRQEDENIDESDDVYDETSFTDDQIVQREAARATFDQREEAINELDKKISKTENLYDAENIILPRERLNFRLAKDGLTTKYLQENLNMSPRLEVGRLLKAL